MTYKWTLDYIDTLTWPTIKNLLAAIKEYPPADFVVGSMFKTPSVAQGFDPKKIPASMPVKRGKVGLVKAK